MNDADPATHSVDAELRTVAAEVAAALALVQPPDALVALAHRLQHALGQHMSRRDALSDADRSTPFDDQTVAQMAADERQA